MACSATSALITASPRDSRRCQRILETPPLLGQLDVPAQPQPDPSTISASTARESRPSSRSDPPRPPAVDARRGRTHDPLPSPPNPSPRSLAAYTEADRLEIGRTRTVARAGTRTNPIMWFGTSFCTNNPIPTRSPGAAIPPGFRRCPRTPRTSAPAVALHGCETSRSQWQRRVAALAQSSRRTGVARRHPAVRAGECVRRALSVASSWICP